LLNHQAIGRAPTTDLGTRGITERPRRPGLSPREHRRWAVRQESAHRSFIRSKRPSSRCGNHSIHRC